MISIYPRALGCVIAFYVNRRHVFYQDVEVLRYNGGKILDEQVCEKWGYSDDLIAVILRMVIPLEKARQTAKEVEEETYKNDRQWQARPVATRRRRNTGSSRTRTKQTKQSPPIRRPPHPLLY